MAKNSSVNLDITNNADGFDISGGNTKRKLTVTGGDIELDGSGTNTYMFPESSDTLVGRDSTDTLTNKTIDTASNTITVVASDVSDFDTEVANNSAVTANTAKITNATHTGDVTGATTLTLDKSGIVNKGTVTADALDYVLISDTDDTGNLKKAAVSDFAAAGGAMLISTYDPTAVGADAFDMDNMSEGTNNKILSVSERASISNQEAIDSDSFEPTGFVNRTDSTISFVDGTRTFSIQPSSTSFDIYQSGVKTTISSQKDLVISDTEGIHFIYLDGDTLGELTAFSESLYRTYVYVAAIYWDATNSKSVYLGEERHGIIMDGDTHRQQHNSTGTIYFNGLELGDFPADTSTSSLDSDCQFSITNGQILDEDIITDIVDGSPLDLSPIATLPIIYKDGASGLWRIDDPRVFPCKNFVGGNGLVAYNQFTGGSWQQTEVSSNDHTMSHIFATNDIRYPVVVVQGQSTFNTITEAREAAPDEINNVVTDGLPFQEFVAVATIIITTDNISTNTPKATIRDISTGVNFIDHRFSSINTVTGSSGISDHGLLAGLSDDDHTQYHNDTRADTWLGTKDLDDIADGTTYVRSENNYDDAAVSKLAGIEGGAEVNNISDANATDLTDGGDSTIHFHYSDRDRANHTGTQTASTISDFATEVNSSLTTVPISKGGTNLTTVANGSILAANSTDVLSAVTRTTGTSVLKNSAGTISWVVSGGFDYQFLNGAGNWASFDISLDSTPQLGGDLDWNSNGIKLIGQTVGGSDGEVVYLSDSTTWSQADATAESTCSNMLGIRISTTEVLTHGVYTTTGLTAGAIYYVSETAGAITTTKPSTSTSIVRVLGYALNTTELFVDPDKTWVENS